MRKVDKQEVEMCTIDKIKQICEQQGVKFIGILKMKNELVQFNVKNHSTFSIRRERFSAETLKQKLEEVKQLYTT